MIARICRYLYAIEITAVVIALGSIVLITLVQVFFRYVLGSSLLWTPELTKLVFIWMTFIGSAAALYRRRHLRIDSLTNVLPQRAQTVLSLVAHFMIIALMWFFVFYGYRVVGRVAGTQIPSLRISRSFVVLPLVIGGILVVISAVHNIVEDFHKLRKITKWD